MTELLTVKDVKNCLGIGNDKAYSLFKQKSFPGIRINGRYLVKRDKFEAWLDDISKLPDRCYKIDIKDKE